MKNIKTLIFFLFLPAFIETAVSAENAELTPPGIGKAEVNAVLKELDAAIAERDKYLKKKEWRLTNLDVQLGKARDWRDSLRIYSRLFDEYRYYQFDSAWCCAKRMESLAVRNGDRVGLARARTGLLFCYKSAGFFSEALATIRDFRTDGLPEELLGEYYLLCAETYLNLSSYVHGVTGLSKEYDRTKLEYYELARKCFSPGSFGRELAELEVELHRNYSDSMTIEGRKSLISSHDIGEHEEAVQYSILANAYVCRNHAAEATYYRALSAIFDIRSCTRETTSARVLAEYMYETGDITRAYSYIRQALRDAEAYNTRIRMLEINTVLPVIENGRYDWIRGQRTVFLSLVIVVTLLLLLSVVLFFKLRSRTRRLSEAHEQLKRSSDELSRTNKSLTETNGRLNEANEIKDQYIARSLCGNFGFVNEVEEQTRFAVRKIMARQYDDAIGLLSGIGIRKERERIYAAFDSAFLKLFPNFIDEYNRLFPPENRVELDDNGTLPMETRIFALMRLGVENSAEVAEYLNISVNTIYVYKTKVKSRSLVPKEEFDGRIRAIPKP